MNSLDRHQPKEHPQAKRTGGCMFTPSPPRGGVLVHKPASVR